MGLTIKPFKDKLYFRRMKNSNPEGIFLPDTAVEDCAWNELIGYGPECKYMKPEYIGMCCKLPVMHNELHRLGYFYEDVDGELVEPEEWCFPESALIELVGYFVLMDEPE